MKSLLQLLAVLCTLIAAGVAHAEPTAYYDRNSGRVFLQNDTQFFLIFIFESESGRMTGTPNDIDSGFVDSADLPFVLTILHVPPTGDVTPPDFASAHDLGIFIPDGGPVGDLEFETLHLSGTNIPIRRPIVVIPEPSCITLSLLALIGRVREK